jgi:class 3 adenylate cyclase
LAASFSADVAPPGGICLSAAIHDNLRSRLDLPIHDLCERSLVSFPRAVRAFRLGGRTLQPAESAAPGISPAV